ncbi:hypothetical protein F441_16492, partial [Phytophthora nicotianae CJ01A1]
NHSVFHLDTPSATQPSIMPKLLLILSIAVATLLVSTSVGAAAAEDLGCYPACKNPQVCRPGNDGSAYCG